ncbi:cytochrome c peroxidase [uncultured Photobacterium sp.]|uniref:cytochrome-c peroxidase n=1 Tax=uncultured Photobacterium sp. TaxID=173973 RepID=UPI002606479B|nr:cytochrome c peroxidase [uncultured Photobacterium sp.]
MTQPIPITSSMFSVYKNNKAVHILILSGLVCGIFFPIGQAKAKKTSITELTYIEELGKRLFFENISDPKRMSCSSCHLPEAGGTNGVSGENLHQVAVTGADPHTVGSLKPPTNKYVQFLDSNGDVQGLPNFGGCGSFPTLTCGGAFWNGRAKGDSIDNIDIFVNNQYKVLYEKYLGPVTDQAHASPFINPVEQGKTDKQSVCEQVAGTKWGTELYRYAWGLTLNCEQQTIDQVFARFAVSLGAWQMSYENNTFNSKRDIALKNDADGLFPLDDFTNEENLGHDLFYGVAENRDDLQFGQARCVFCHLSSNSDGTGEFERYTDDSYHNIGIPRNYEIPGSPEPNVGLKATTGNPNHLGSHKTPTLRNVDQRQGNGFIKAYGHNGFFKSLESIIHFYNTAIAKPSCESKGILQATEKEALANNCWPAPEFADTSALGFIGNLGLSASDEAAIVAYLKTLTDTSIVDKPTPYKSSKYDQTRLSN